MRDEGQVSHGDGHKSGHLYIGDTVSIRRPIPPAGRGAFRPPTAVNHRAPVDPESEGVLYVCPAAVGKVIMSVLSSSSSEGGEAAVYRLYKLLS